MVWYRLLHGVTSPQCPRDNQSTSHPSAGSLKGAGRAPGESSSHLKCCSHPLADRWALLQGTGAASPGHTATVTASRHRRGEEGSNPLILRVEKYQLGDLNDSTEATEESAQWQGGEERKGNQASRPRPPFPRPARLKSPKPPGCAPFPAGDGCSVPMHLRISAHCAHPRSSTPLCSGAAPCPPTSLLPQHIEHSPLALQLLAEMRLSQPTPVGRGMQGTGFPPLCSVHPALTAQKGCSGSREQGFKSRLPPSHPPQPFPKAPSSLAQPWAGGGWPAALPAAPHYSQYRPSVGCRTPRVCAVLQGENSDNIRDIKL